MAAERLLVIGGVAAGMSAASRARAVNPRLEALVLEKGATVSYGACGLPFWLSGEVARGDDLVVFTPEEAREQRGIDVRIHHEAVEIVHGRKVVVARVGDQHEEFKYDKLVIATGAAPTLNVEGADREGVFHINTMASTTALMDFLGQRKPRHALIVGGGYIGVEAADALRRRRMEVTLLDRGTALLDGFEPEISGLVRERFEAGGVRLLLEASVDYIDRKRGGGLTVLYNKTLAVEPDLVLVATGLRPRTELAHAAGVETGPTGALRTDDRQQTNLHGVYAAGDCAEAHHLVTERPAYVPLGTTANKQGRVAGENAAGGLARFPGIVGTMVTKAFGLEIARTGLSLEAARAEGFHPVKAVIESRSRAGYMGGKPIRVALVVDRESGRVLGGQLAGEEGAARRVDTVATALTSRMSLSDFVHLDLGYAPPFGPVYDPLLVAAWQAMKLTGKRR